MFTKNQRDKLCSVCFDLISKDRIMMQLLFSKKLKANLVNVLTDGAVQDLPIYLWQKNCSKYEQPMPDLESGNLFDQTLKCPNRGIIMNSTTSEIPGPRTKYLSICNT